MHLYNWVSPDNDVMAYQSSDIQLQHFILEAHNTVYLTVSMEKERNQNRFLDLRWAVSSSSTNAKCLKVPQSSVQMRIQKCKQ